MDVEKEIINLIRQKGPLTGAEIKASIDGDGLALWRACNLSPQLLVRRVGTRYLRLDRRLQHFARLSPSIFREFLTYTVVGLNADAGAVGRRVREVTTRIEDISRGKLDLLYRLVCGLVSRIESEWRPEHRVCFIIAGDIVHIMAHDVPRPERSTGKLVMGSDMDLVVVTDNETPESSLKRLDDAIYREKYRILMTPSLREEIDYVVKRLERVREQMHCDDFKHLVACKILQEGTFLYGSETLFTTIKGMLREHGVNAKLERLERRARQFREEAEEALLREKPDRITDESGYLFYPSEESEEFE
jgi:hypothetical protein